MNLTNRQIFGRSGARFGKRLLVFPVIERSDNFRWHQHATIERPADIEFTEFYALLVDNWDRTDWGKGQSIRLEPDADQGWANYMTKLRTKPNFAMSIDWENVNNHR